MTNNKETVTTLLKKLEDKFNAGGVFESVFRIEEADQNRVYFLENEILVVGEPITEKNIMKLEILATTNAINHLKRIAALAGSSNVSPTNKEIIKVCVATGTVY